MEIFILDNLENKITFATSLLHKCLIPIMVVKFYEMEKVVQDDTFSMFPKQEINRLNIEKEKKQQQQQRTTGVM